MEWNTIVEFEHKYTQNYNFIDPNLFKLGTIEVKNNVTKHRNTSEYFHAKLKAHKNILTFTALYNHELKFQSKIRNIHKTKQHSNSTADVTM